MTLAKDEALKRVREELVRLYTGIAGSPRDHAYAYDRAKQHAGCTDAELQDLALEVYTEIYGKI